MIHLRRASLALAAPLVSLLVACSGTEEEPPGSQEPDGEVPGAGSSSGQASSSGSSRPSGSSSGGTASSSSGGSNGSSSGGGNGSSGSSSGEVSSSSGGSSGTSSSSGGIPLDPNELTPATLPATCGSAWCSETMRPSGAWMTAMLGYPDGTVLAGGTNTMLVYANHAWAHESLPFEMVVTALGGTRPDDTWAAGSTCEAGKSVLAHRTAAGWSKVVTTLACTELKTIWSTDAGDLFVGTYATTWQLHDGTWTAWPVGSADRLWGRGETVYAVNYGSAHRFTNGVWTDLRTEIPAAILGPDGFGASAIDGLGLDDVWLGMFHQLLHYDGTTWTHVANLDVDDIAVDGVGTATVLSGYPTFKRVVGTNVTSFSPPDASGPVDLRTIVAAGPRIVAGGADGALVRTVGTQAVVDSRRDLRIFSGEWFVSGTERVVIEDEFALRWNGTSYVPLGNQQIGLPDADSVWSGGPNAVFVSTDEGAVSRFDGTTWTPRFPANPVEWHPRVITGSSPSHVAAVGPGLVTEWNGTSWSDHTAPTFGDSVISAVMTDTELFVSGWDGVHVRTASGWSTVPSLDGPWYVLALAPNGDVAAMGHHHVGIRHEGVWTFENVWLEGGSTTYAAAYGPDNRVYVLDRSERVSGYQQGAGYTFLSTAPVQTGVGITVSNGRVVVVGGSSVESHALP